MNKLNPAKHSSEEQLAESPQDAEHTFIPMNTERRNTAIDAALISQKEDIWDYDQDGRIWKSCAVVATDGQGNDVLLHAFGPAIDWHIDQDGHTCEAVGLDQYPKPGVWVFEGSMGSVRVDSIEYGVDYDFEAHGDWRSPTPDEWECIKEGECPWDKENLPKWKAGEKLSQGGYRFLDLLDTPRAKKPPDLG